MKEIAFSKLFNKNFENIKIKQNMKKLNKKKKTGNKEDYKSLFLAKIIQSIPDNYLMTFLVKN